MNESTIISEHSSPCASLAAIGVQIQQLDLFAPIRQTVRIAQKTVKYTPTDKLATPQDRLELLTATPIAD